MKKKSLKVFISMTEDSCEKWEEIFKKNFRVRKQKQIF